MTQTTLVRKNDLSQALHRQSWGLIGLVFAQAAVVIAFLQ
jgi:hypothetical protein